MSSWNIFADANGGEASYKKIKTDIYENAYSFIWTNKSFFLSSVICVYQI